MNVLGEALAVTQAAAKARRWAVILVGGILWAVIAYGHNPYRQGVEFNRSFWDYPFRALFDADVFRIVLLSGIAFWIAYRVAAIYLDDVFEIGNVEVAKRYLRQAAFADSYGTIEIANGRVSDRDQQSPIFLIGGPGRVRMNLENAALFEKIDGYPSVIPPTGPFPGGVALLDGFERLRTAIDLRDHFEEMQIISRTRDGIRVIADDVRVIYSVDRNGLDPTLDTPYPFIEDAITTLVYRQPRLGRGGVTNWTATMNFLVSQKLGNFITRHTLGEFLAAIGDPEIGQLVDDNATLQEQANVLAGAPGPLPGVPPTIPEAPDFAPRSEISDLFYNYEDFIEDATMAGVSLRWIGVGTWKISDEIIPEQHQTAWRISRENLVRGSPDSLANLREESRLGELRVLVYDVPVGIARGMDRKVESRKREYLLALVHAYRGKLRSALDIYEREGEGETAQAKRLRKCLDHLAHVVYRYLGDSGNGA